MDISIKPRRLGIKILYSEKVGAAEYNSRDSSKGRDDTDVITPFLTLTSLTPYPHLRKRREAESYDVIKPIYIIDIVIIFPYEILLHTPSFALTTNADLVQRKNPWY